MNRCWVGIAAAAAGLFVACGAWAADYPNRRITIVMPFSAGSSPDVLTRQLAERLEKRMGQRVIVENRPGANSTIGATAVARSAPDGYTVLWAAASATSAARTFQKSLPYDPSTAFAAVMLYQEVYFTFVVRPEEKGTTFAQFLDKMRANPAIASIGGTGSITQIISAMIESAGRVGHTYVPYTNTGLMINDVIAGRLGAAIHTVSQTVPLVTNGQAVALAVTAPEPLPSLPGAPPMAASLPGVALGTFNGYFVPAGTPRDIVEILHRHMSEVFAEPDLVARSLESGRPLNLTPDQADAYVRAEEPRWLELARKAGVEPQ